jgi:hypothetical protein
VLAALPIGAAIVIVADHLRRSLFERETRAMIVRTSTQERAVDVPAAARTEPQIGAPNVSSRHAAAGETVSARP